MGPEAGASPVIPPEGEPKSPKFNMRVENPAEFLNAIRKGESGDVGTRLMVQPVKEVDVDLFSKGDHFDLKVDITVPQDVIMGDKSIENIRQMLLFEGYKDVLKQKYSDVAERGEVVIVKGKNGTNLVLGRSSELDAGVSITTGRFQEHDFDDPLQLAPSPESTEQALQSTLADLNESVNYLLTEIYTRGGKPVPEDEILLHLPKKNVRNDLLKRAQYMAGIPDLPSLPQQESGAPNKVKDISTPTELIGKLQIEKPNVSFDSIGGQVDAKREVQGLAFALKNPELYKKWGTRPPKGIILHGPPGTGKTLMARALASQADARFFHVEASDIASKWYGESEQLMKQIFEAANQGSENTIIFFDEIDAIAPDRDGSHEATRKVVGTLLENMDGLAANPNVMVVASTNKLDSLDPALVRAGRFDRWVEVPLPDEEGRRQIIDIHMKKAVETAGRPLFSNVDLETIISSTDNMNGADLAEITRRVLEEKVRQEGTGQEPTLVTTDDIVKEVKKYERIKQAKNKMGFQVASRT